jgi:hypothetical protein
MVERQKSNSHFFPTAFNLAGLAAFAVALTSCCCPQPQSCCGEMAANGAASSEQAAEPAEPGKGGGLPTSPVSGGDKATTAPSTPATTPCDALIPKSHPPTRENPLKVTAFEREGALSCWSTCGEMIMDYIGGIRVRQCCQSSRLLYNSQPCCDPSGNLPSLGVCDKDGYPDFLTWKFYFGSPSSKALLWPDVQKEINEGRPFAFSRVDKINSPDAEHMVVVIGWLLNGTEQVLLILDPRPFQAPAALERITYSDYAGNVQYDHKLTFSGISAP